MYERIVHMTIDGQWLTDFLRTWFWDENRPFEKCQAIVADCMVRANESQIRQVTTDLLEYRKTFQGQNEFE